MRVLTQYTYSLCPRCIVCFLLVRWCIVVSVCPVVNFPTPLKKAHFAFNHQNLKPRPSTECSTREVIHPDHSVCRAQLITQNWVQIVRTCVCSTRLTSPTSSYFLPQQALTSLTTHTHTYTQLDTHNTFNHNTQVDKMTFFITNTKSTCQFPEKTQHQLDFWCSQNLSHFFLTHMYPSAQSALVMVRLIHWQTHKSQKYGRV